ncbi:tRNA (N6-isopentenyl adenosine(37)-C2)-methylthiotransferase MiaB [Pelagibacterales bacterium SAG-MED15]|nr:tRNA (N6-isopentenyl adenosine(37)-C2)-methylthiotransferase MiaB [Pelagibacterales bacterium SAG-MED15]
MAKKVFIKTFGCQMNQYDSNRILDIVKKIGFIETKSLDESNCFILNTCHIRDKAKEKVYHEIGRVKERFIQKDKPLIIVAGCVAQAENTEMLKREPYIDFVIGPQSYHKLNNTIKNFEKNKVREEITDFESITKFEYLSKIKNKINKVSSYITIQEGCDKFCHFCVVPYTRGPEFSRPLYQIISEAEESVKKGSKEIILLGQNVNAYCSNENGKQYKLSDLIMSLEKINELKRIRYITSHPRDMSDDLIECYANSKKLMPFIHLPIQSGSNKILKLMNRKHKVEDYIVTYEKLKKINMNIEFSSDFLIGYPGENEEDFEATLYLIKKLKFLNSYSFIFSPRPGTVASNYNLVDEQVSKERLKIIQAALFNNQKLKNKSFENRNIDVLIENEMKDKKNLFGRNEYMTSVILKGNKSLIGKVLPVKIISSNQNSLFGEVDNNKIEAA